MKAKKTFLLDTDICSLYFRDHEKVANRVEQAKKTDQLGTTVITRAEVLRGRFDALFKAEDGDQLQIAMARLIESDRALDKLRIFVVNSGAGAQFDKLLKKTKRSKRKRSNVPIYLLPASFWRTRRRWLCAT